MLMETTPGPPTSTRRGGSNTVSTILSIVALILATGALVTALVVSGPAGPAGINGANGANGTNGTTGPQGPRGPAGVPGNGTLTSIGIGSPPLATIGSSCTNSGVSVTITVPGPGELIVQGTTQLRINHTAGTEDRWLVAIGSTTTECPTMPWSWVDSVGTNDPTQAQYWKSAYVQAPWGVTEAGTYTWYLNAYMIVGQDPYDMFIQTYMIVTFYPT